MISIQHLRKTFQGEPVVNGLSMSIRKGSIFGLLGSNGAGKTTLLKMLAGIYNPEEGTLLLDGQPVFEHTDTKQRLFFVPDSPVFFSQSSIRQMADFYRSVYTGWSDSRYKQLASVFKLDQTRKLHRFSKGMQRQAALWLALSCMPEVLILDEPIDGLDPVMRRQIKNLLFQEAAEREMTVVISSHNIREIEDLCDHIGIMHKGRLLLERELDSLKADTHKVQVAFRKREQEQELHGKLNILYKEMRGSVRIYVVRGNKEQITDAFLSCDPLIFDLLPLTLEEIFIYEMGDADYEAQSILL